MCMVNEPEIEQQNRQSDNAGVGLVVIGGLDVHDVLVGHIWFCFHFYFPCLPIARHCTVSPIWFQFFSFHAVA